MNNSQQIKELTELQNKDHLISSLYLRLWPDARFHRTRLKDLIREKKEELDQKELPPNEKQFVERDFEKMQEYVDAVSEGSFRGLAIFSSDAMGLWEVIPLTLPVHDLLVIENSTHIHPLVSILNNYRRIYTVLVDRSHARFFEIFMGEIREDLQVSADVPRPRDMGEYRLNERRVERHIQDHVRIHLNNVAERILSHFQDKGFDWLFLGGQPEILVEMEAALPSILKDRLKATFRMDLISNAKEVLERSLGQMEEVKKSENQVLVSRLSDSLHPEGLGVSGILETLSSLYEGCVHTLIIEEGFIQKGACCPECGFMGLNAGVCPMCHEPTVPVPDIVEEAVASAVERDCEIVHVGSESGIKELGSIGALLRYKPVIEKRPREGELEISETAF